jgi:6-phosphogluconolactonase
MPELEARSSRLLQHEFSDSTSAAQALASAIAQHLNRAIAARGKASLIVPGGRSPIPLFAALREQPVDWKCVWITLTDERWVDVESPDSNEHLLHEHLLVDAASAAHFIPLKSAQASAALALDDRTRQLQKMPRPVDVVMLGMGDDGHIASLFPNAEGLAAALNSNGPAQLVAMQPPNAPHSRISHSLSSLLDARQIALLLHGEKKRACFDEALAGASPLLLPIAAVLAQMRVPVDVYWS